MENNLRDYYKDVYLAGSFPYAHQFTPSGKAAGAILAVSSIKDALPILHGPAGCGFHYRYLCRRSNLPAYDLQCTDLSENDMIMGGAAKLRKTILETAGRFHPQLIAVIPTAPVDMIHDDIESVIHELQPQIAAKLIYVRSERISHADKRHNGRIAFSQTKTECAHLQNFDGDLKSCGFSEAMKAVVQTIMKPQPVISGSVNLCGMFLGNGGHALAAGMMEELKNIGATANAFIPECSMAELETAPRVALNLITWRINWAVKMKEVFGTEYFQVDRDEYGYSGLDGIQRLYHQIAGKLGLQNADAYLTLKKQEVHWSLLKSKAYMEKYSCVLCSSDYRTLSKQLRFFKSVLKFNIPYVLVELRQKNYTSIYSMEELKRFAEKFIEEASAEADPNTKWLINPTQAQADAIFSRVDYIAGQYCFGSQKESIKYIENPRFIPLNFDDFQRFVLDYTTKIKLRLSNGLPEYFSAYKGEAEESCANANASLAFWEKLWIQGG